jgi:tRNA A-37 threonylcarbamoyl transferase component Bud32
MNSLAGTDYERLREADTFLFVRTDRRLMLQKNGLVRFGDFMTCPHGELVQSHGLRDVVRLVLKDETGSQTVFLKRFGPMHLKDALKDLLLFRRARTRAVLEFDMLSAFRRAGLAVPGVLACGERHVLGRDRASFLMVDGLASGEPLDTVLSRLHDIPRRRRLIASAAEFVRRMHQAGCSHTDLFAKHLFVTEGEDGKWSVAVIDLQRAVRRPSLTVRLRARDLASLMVSLAHGATTRRERLEFLLAYLDRTKLTKDDVTFVRTAVLPQARKLSRRTGYQAWRPILEHT